MIKTPDGNRENSIELSKRHFLTKHRVYPELFERPEWDTVTESEQQQLAETRAVLEARERTGLELSILVSRGKYDVNILHFDKPMRDRVEVIKSGLNREDAYDFIRHYDTNNLTKKMAASDETITPMTKRNKPERQQRILSTLLDTIKPEKTGWREISKAIESLHVLKPDGWLEVREMLQYALDQGYISRPEFDPNADDEYYFATTQLDTKEAE